MADDLDKPETDDDLYLARGEEVPRARPLMTGDVVTGLAIPGVSEEPAVGMAVTHPCSMRVDGVHLIPKVHVALVDPSEPLAWKTCPRSRMPLPELRPAEFYVVRFDLVGMVDSEALEAADRIACLAIRGVNILQQRLIWYFTRLVAPTGHLNELFTSVFEETDMQEEWVDRAVEADVAPDVAANDFHEWIRDDDGGKRRQDRLRDPQSRAPVRRALEAELRSRYGS